MKKIALLIVLLASIFTYSQENDFKYIQDENKKTELKISTTSLIALAAIDISYERLINKETSYGVSVFIGTNVDDIDIDLPKDFSITPFFRWFFNERSFARGFFVEGFGMLNSFSNTDYDFSRDFQGNFISNEVESNSVQFALGVSVGGKFVIKSGFTAEVFLGVGRNLLGEDNSFYGDHEFVSRGGISLGYRF